MRINREKIATLLALLILLVGLWSVVRGFTSPVRAVEVPEATVTESTRKVLYKSYRVFADETEAMRNPFSFSEGWQRMETTPMALPPLPVAPRPASLLWPGATAAEAGLPWMDLPPADISARTEGNG